MMIVGVHESGCVECGVSGSSVDAAVHVHLGSQTGALRGGEALQRLLEQG
jgi:hypothetical protein